ncbi:MAG: hypothetical protein WC375_00300 [Methanomassiliicoccales archaeon]|jgi:hypothetical protein
MAKFQKIKMIARQGRHSRNEHNSSKGIRKKMPTPTRVFDEDEDDDRWKREVNEWRIEHEQDPSTHPNSSLQDPLQEKS